MAVEAVEDLLSFPFLSGFDVLSYQASAPGGRHCAVLVMKYYDIY